MKIPKDDYTIESFLEYLVNNLMKVFEYQPKWLKVHLLFAKRSWKEIFEFIPTEEYGEILHIMFDNKDDDKTIDFYAYEWAAGPDEMDLPDVIQSSVPKTQKIGGLNRRYPFC